MDTCGLSPPALAILVSCISNFHSFHQSFIHLHRSAAHSQPHTDYKSHSQSVSLGSLPRGSYSPQHTTHKHTTMLPSIPLHISLSLLTLLTTSTAFPLFPRRQNLAPRASYSVVAVDGGSSTAAANTPAPPPTTIISTATNLLTHTQTVMQTKLSTVVITQGASPTTIIVTVTSASATTVVETPKVVTQTLSAVQPSTVKESPVTVTVTSEAKTTETVAPSTKAYDDGSWHTSYFYTVTTPAPNSIPAPSPPPSSSAVSSSPPNPAPSSSAVSSPAAVPSPEAPAPAPAAGSFDDGSWAKWAGQGNGGQWQGPPKA